MADSAPVVHIGENTPQEVAWKLMQLIRGNTPGPAKTKEDILNLYADCLTTVYSPNLRADINRK